MIRRVRLTVTLWPSVDLCAPGETREAAALGVVKVDVLNSRIAEEPLDRWYDALTFAYIGVNDHVSRIVRPKRNQTKTDVPWHLVDLQEALLRALAHKYGTRGLVR